MKNIIDTDLSRNIQNIQPFLGLALVAVVVFAFAQIILTSTEQLAQSFHSQSPAQVNGTLILTSKSPVHYGSSVSFRADIYDVTDSGTPYISTTCFQGSKLVYERSAQLGVAFPLLAQYDKVGVWDGKPASCSAVLLYRLQEGGAINVYVLNAVSFDVVE